MQPAMQEALAVGRTAEDRELAAEKSGAGRHLHGGSPHQARAVEEDGLLGQPFEPASGSRGDADIDAGIPAGCPIDLFRRLGGSSDARSVAGLDGDVQAIAAGEAARGGEQDHAKGLAGLAARKQDAAGCPLEEARHPGAAGSIRDKTQLGHATAPLEPVVERAEVGGEGGIVSHVRR